MTTGRPGAFAISIARGAQRAERFKEYGVGHMAKDPPDVEKARRNYEMFELCRAALQASSPAIERESFTLKGRAR